MRPISLCASAVAAASLLGVGATAAALLPAAGSLVQLPGRAGCVSYGGHGGCTPVRGLLSLGRIVTSDDGRNVYVTGDMTLVMRRNKTSGALAQLPGADGCLQTGGYASYRYGCATVSGGAYVGVVSSLSRDGKTAYGGFALYEGVNFRPIVVGFERTRTGALRQFSSPPVCVESEPNTCLQGKSLGGPALVSHDGRNVYLTLGGGIWTFRRDVQTGELTQVAGPSGCIIDHGFLKNVRHPPHCVEARTLAGAGSPVESADGRNVYAVSVGDNAVDVLRRNRGDGTLEQLPGKGGCVASTGLGGACSKGRGLHEPVSIALSGDGRNAYVVSSRLVSSTSPKSHTLSIFRRNARTGALTQLPGRTGCVSNSGRFGCTKGAGLFGAESVAVSPDGRSVYVASRFDQDVAVFRRDPRTGAVIQLSGTDACAGAKAATFSGYVCAKARIAIAEAVAVSPDNRTVYVGSWDNSGPGGAVAGQVAVFRRVR